MSDSHRRTDEPIEQRVAAERNEEFVVFHIGLRINAFWKLHRWLPIFLIAPRMVRELVSDPESGLLGSRTVVGPGIRNVGFVQYWDSFEALREYARDSDRLHFPVWQDYYEDGTKEDAAVGIWHETYVVDPDEYETVYNNMPPHGLAASDDTEIVPASDQRKTAAGRLGHTDGTVLRDSAGIAWRTIGCDRPDADYTVQYRRPDDADWATRCIVRDVPREMRYFEATCEYFEHAPESAFTGDPVVTLATERGHLKLSPERLTESVGADVDERAVGRADWYRLLEEAFGIEYRPSNQVEP